MATSAEEDLLKKARELLAFGQEVMDREDLLAAAEIITRALILFLALEDRDGIEETERLLTRISPVIGPLRYAAIRRKVEAEMGARPPEEAKRKTRQRPPGPKRRSRPQRGHSRKKL